MIKLEDKSNIGVSIINEGHKTFVGILNKATIVNEHNGNTEEIKELLGEMIEYSLKHFSKEEACMAKFKFADYQLHRKEHLVFASKTIMCYHNLLMGDYQISNEILEYLKTWLVNHIQVSDKTYVNYLNEDSKSWYEDKQKIIKRKMEY